MRKKIPQWSWYNGRFLLALGKALKDPSKNTTTIQEFLTEFKQNNGLENYDYLPDNQGTTLSLLYGLLVVPREIWEKDKTSGTQFSFTTKSKFSFLKSSKDLDNWEFIGLMRNAVSHANFDIDTLHAQYTFWNCPPNTQDCSQESKQINFKVSILEADLGTFLTELAMYYINNVAKNSK